MVSSTPGIVVIGRNEGVRLLACLASLPHDAARVYVDSGSTDGSVAAAAAAGAVAVELPPGTRFTAGLARNAGLARLDPAAELVQMVDGDCALAPGWLAAGTAALAADPGLAAVFGRLRERYPDHSLFNRLCDDEWNVPVGEVAACGGNALFRRTAIAAAGGYTPGLIAGEEPELCLRLRQAGWRIARIDAEMGWHDAAMTRFGQWWRRTTRTGHAFAELAWRHGRRGDPHWRRAVRSSAGWALGVPATVLLLTLLVGPAGLLALLVYPAQVARLTWKERHLGYQLALAKAGLLVLGRFAELGGTLRFAARHLTGAGPMLIEHKRPG